MENYYLNFTTVYFYGNGICVNITPIAIRLWEKLSFNLKISMK
jgi:hypothetical protein